MAAFMYNHVNFVGFLKYVLIFMSVLAPSVPRDGYILHGRYFQSAPR